MTTPDTNLRFTDTDPYLWKLAEKSYIECPKCNQKAIVKGNQLSCLNCGFNKMSQNNSKWLGPLYGMTGRNCAKCGRFIKKYFVEYKELQLFNLKCPGCHHFSQEEINWYPVKYVGHDPYFGAKLYLYSEIGENVLWAYNYEHLEFIELYVQAKLRERIPNHNSSLASRLPKWIKDKKNREPILKAIKKLQSKG